MESEYQANFSEWYYHFHIPIFEPFPLGAPSLALKASPGYGIHVHVKKRDVSKLSKDAQFVPLTSNTTTGTFFHQVCP